MWKRWGIRGGLQQPVVVSSFSYAKVWAEYLHLEAPVVLESGIKEKPIEPTDWTEFVGVVTGRKKTTTKESFCCGEIVAGPSHDVSEDAAFGPKY